MEIYDAIYLYGKPKDYRAEAATIAELVRARNPQLVKPAGVQLNHVNGSRERVAAGHHSFHTHHCFRLLRQRSRRGHGP